VPDVLRKLGHGGDMLFSPHIDIEAVGRVLYIKFLALSYRRSQEQNEKHWISRFHTRVPFV